MEHHSRVCFVPYCYARKNMDCFSFHSFPQREDLKNAWLKALKVKKLARHAFVCSRHFRDDDFLPSGVNNRKLLKKNSVPSRFLPLETDEVPLDLNASSETFEVSADELLAQDDQCEVMSIGGFSNISLDSHFSDIYTQLPKKELKDSEIQVGILQIDQSSQTNPIKRRHVKQQATLANKSLINVGVQACEMVFPKDKLYFNVIDLIRTDKEMELFTGFDNSTLDIVTKCLYKVLGWDISLNRTLSLKHRLILTLIKVKFEWPFHILSALFQVSKREARYCFNSTIKGLKLLIRGDGIAQKSSIEFELTDKCFGTEKFRKRLSDIAINFKMSQMAGRR